MWRPGAKSNHMTHNACRHICFIAPTFPGFCYRIVYAIVSSANEWNYSDLVVNIYSETPHAVLLFQLLTVFF